MQGIEFVKDRKTKEPAVAACCNVFERMKDHRVLLGKGGLYGTVLRMSPPLCANKEDIEYCLKALDICLEEEK